MRTTCYADGGPIPCGHPTCYFTKECNVKPFVRSAYNYDMDTESEKAGLTCPEKTLTQQQFREEADINTIVERFKLTGQLPQLDKLPEYGDYEGVFDFQTAMNTIRQAEETFMELPAHLRARFHNNPQEFLQFCGDPDNLPEAKKLGILSPEAISRLETEELQQEIKRGEDRARRAQELSQSRTAAGGAAPTEDPGGEPQGTRSQAPKGDRSRDR